MDPNADRPRFLSRNGSRAAILWTAGALLVVYSLVIATTDGLDVTVAGIRIRSRSWERPAFLAAVCILTAALTDRRRVVLVAGRIRRGASRAVTFTRRATSAAGVALLAGGWTLAAGIAFGTYAAGGADSSGYLNQARLFSQGRVLDEVRLARQSEWPGSQLARAPLGYIPARDRFHLAPTYPPGYPLLMAPTLFISDRAPYFVVPLCGALAVWLTFAIGRRLGEPSVGAAAALLVSVSPTFLYQLVQPMGDVPVTAAWLLSIWLATRGTLASAVFAGLAAGTAILIRPNLLPLAPLVWAACALVSQSSGGWRRAVAAAVSTAPAVLTLGIIQSVRYGSPFGSGYGSMSSLFAWANIGPNLDRYPRWMFETHTPLIALFLLAPLWLWHRRADVRSFFLILWLFCIAVVAAYLPYVYFQPFEWMYTRFFLPALPLMWLLTLTPVAALLRRVRQPVGASIGIIGLLCLMVFSLHGAMKRYAFELRDGERKYAHAADYVRRVLPENAVIVSMQHSGSIWFYARRPIVRWDYVAPARLDETLEWLRAHGYAPYLVVDQEEFIRIQKRFGASGQRSYKDIDELMRFGDVVVYALR